MKKIILICCGYLLFIATTCTKDSDTQHHHIKFYNASDSDIYIDAIKSLGYPDSTLSRVQNVVTPGWNLMVQAHSANNDALVSRNSYEYYFNNTYDTLIVFVFNSDTLALYGWDYVKMHYMIAQRYDLSLGDLQKLNWELQFPPSYEMRDISMWPPYGTYDATGHRVDTIQSAR